MSLTLSWLGWLARRAALVYVVWCTVLYFMQDRMIFPAAFDQPAEPLDDDQLLSLRGRRVSIENEGAHVEGIWVCGDACTSTTPGPAVIYLHGNGETIDDCYRLAEVRRYVRLGASVLLAEYRGFGRSTGRPSEAAIGRDMDAFVQWLHAQPEVDATRIVYHGRSLGGGVAVSLAHRTPPAALVLESTFTSMAELGLRYGAPPYFCRHPFRSERIVGTLGCPIFLSHGIADEVIPISHARRLHQLLPNAVYVETDAGHNNRPSNWNSYWQQLVEFLRTQQILLRGPIESTDDVG